MKKIESINSLRFFAIMLIVFSHFEFMQRFEHLSVVYGMFFKRPTLAVDFFFVLSGFGMMYSYIAKGEPILSKDPVSLVKFGVKHVSKIYKLYAITMLLSAPLYIFYEIKARGVPIADIWWVECAKAVFCIPLLQSIFGVNWISHSFNGVSWFLSSLFCIYLVSPILLSIVKKINALWMAVVSLVLNVAMLAVIRNAFISIQNNTVLDDLTYGSPYYRVFYVLMGMILAKLFVIIKQKLSCNDLKENKMGNKIASVVEVSVVAIVVLFLLLKNSFVAYNETIRILMPYLSLSFACLMVLCFSFENGAVSKFLRRGGATYLGSISMYIFLIHYPIRGYLDATARFAGFRDSEMVGLLNICLTLGLTGLICWKKHKMK